MLNTRQLFLKHMAPTSSFPLMLEIETSEGVYLIKPDGTKMMDLISGIGVSNIGHRHPAVIQAIKDQLDKYLHTMVYGEYVLAPQVELATLLTEQLPEQLNSVYYVNSGSEANELAIRMMKSHTGENDIVVSEHGYHGNTNICVDISSYKFDGKGGKGAPENTHVISMPTKFNGKYKGKNIIDGYIGEVESCIENIRSKKRGLGGFIIEPIIS